MSPDTLFQSASLTAMVGWLLLLIGPLAPALTNRIAGLVIPALLSVGYAALVLAFWSGASGGFDSLPNVMLLFTNPWIALAGWVHYLAFDLFLGGMGSAQGPRGSHPASGDDPGAGADLAVRTDRLRPVPVPVLDLAPARAATCLR